MIMFLIAKATDYSKTQNAPTPPTVRSRTPDWLMLTDVERQRITLHLDGDLDASYLSDREATFVRRHEGGR